MDATREESLRWFPAEQEAAAPDLSILVRDHSGLLYRVALSLLRHPAEAEDVVQEVFLRLLQRQNELSRITEMRAWLVRITWNLALDRLRKKKPEQIDADFINHLVSSDLPADQTLATATEMRQVFAAIQRLPYRERQALLLSAIDELSTSEIAATIGKSESSIRSLLFRARAHLRERLTLEGGIYGRPKR